MTRTTRTRRSARPRTGLLFGLSLGVLLCPPFSFGQVAGVGAPEQNRFYVVVSRSLLTDVAENDAKAAVRAWAEAIARERHLRAEPEPRVAEGPEALGLAWTSLQADVLAITVPEYRDAGIRPREALFVADMTGGSFLAEFLLLVHKDSGVASLSDLEGRSLQTFSNSHASLSLPWLDTALLERGLPPAAAFFGRVTPEKKLSATILPVFFKQRDACLVTRRGFEVMRELNPQIGHQLRILETSPGILPSFSAIRAGRREMLQGIDLEQEIVRLHQSPAGRQILNLFQADSMATISEAEVMKAVAVLQHRDELVARWEKSAAGRKLIAKRGAAGDGRPDALASEDGR